MVEHFIHHLLFHELVWVIRWPVTHIFMGNTSQDSLLKEMDNWPTYYPYQLMKEQVVDEMLHH